VDKITISEHGDWSKKLANDGLKTVLDPMVVRCGEIFLQGNRGASDPANAWDLLDSNLYGVATFFDRLIIDERIPVFDYAATIDMPLSADENIFSKINLGERILQDVHLDYQQYVHIKGCALAELQKVYDGTHPIEPNLAKQILSELSAAEYRWSPNIEDLEIHSDSEDDKRLAAFLLGGLIFTGYAQSLGGDHVLQPKRSRLLLQLSLDKTVTDRMEEEELWVELKSRSKATCDDVPWTPTFFPYLLAKSEKPADVVRLISDLRRSEAVHQYRAWLRDTLSEMRGGVLTEARKAEVRDIAKQVDVITGVASWLPKVHWKLRVVPDVDFDSTAGALWGWVLSNLPKNKYRKFLAQAVAEDHDTRWLNRRMKQVWGNA
jgi:hypothetical protein